MNSTWMAFDRVGFDFARLLVSALWQSSILLVAACVIARILRGRHAAIRYTIIAAAVLASPIIPLLATAASRAGAPQAQIAVIPEYQVVTTAAPAAACEEMKVPAAPQAATSAPPAPKFSLWSYPWAILLAAYATCAAALLALIAIARLRIGRWINRGHIVTDERVLDIFSAAQEKQGVRRCVENPSPLTGEGLPCLASAEQGAPQGRACPTKLQRSGVRVQPRIMVVESDNCLSPMTFGTFHPVILLPKGLAAQTRDADLTAIALHELAHIKRHDSLMLMLLSIVRAVFFFHPLIWLACSLAARLSESACDDAVLEVTGQPIGYARMLVRLAEQMPRHAPVVELAAGIVWSKSAFVRRVEAILSDRRATLRRLSRLGLAATVLAVGVSLLVAEALPLTEKKNNPAATQPAASASTQPAPTSAARRMTAAASQQAPTVQPGQKLELRARFLETNLQTDPNVLKSLAKTLRDQSVTEGFTSRDLPEPVDQEVLLRQAFAEANVISMPSVIFFYGQGASVTSGQHIPVISKGGETPKGTVGYIPIGINFKLGSAPRESALVLHAGRTDLSQDQPDQLNEVSDTFIWTMRTNNCLLRIPTPEKILHMTGFKDGWQDANGAYQDAQAVTEVINEHPPVKGYLYIWLTIAPADASEQAASQTTSAPAQEIWRATFEKAYALPAGEVLHRLAPPFIPERDEFWNIERAKFYDRLPFSNRTPEFLVFTWDPDLKRIELRLLRRTDDRNGSQARHWP